ncbi:protein kintoun isoform X2 [Dunckerocampus dactyliophorus]|uniref:protein kintoun isoform X2 n=1 Tax=Dunckerocampus dactyliophorus TaxID=161453 RepID=UPI0024069818|nr:protein kintoun isoform X2 [Dunckerocampus dactyliophorus]
MELGEKLKELNMSVDEIKRLTKAFKDEKFRGMLRDYAEEIADPENRRIYEEEIAMLEQERGNNVEFVHPQPFRALKTSLNRKQKCYINICGNDKVGKPECKCGMSEDGRRGQCWSLPHNLTPGRRDTDPKGNKIMIYDVIFHPDTLHIANKNSKFMEMVSSTAVKGIQDAFKVTLDENNMKELNTKYKGMPHPCVIRKPVPGFKPKDPAQDQPLAFPYPDEKPQTLSPDPKPRSFEIQREKNKEPTEPSYSVKYRSFIDLQDFRCSRDSAKSPRPKEIIITIDVPLMKSVAHANLEVKEKTLLLESKTPAYKLELPLSYPVDEERAVAKFIKQKGQLTVTLPVLPSKEASEFFAQCAGNSKGTEGDVEVGDKQTEGRESQVHDEEMKNKDEESVKDVIGEEEQLPEKLTGQEPVVEQQEVEEKLYEKERREEAEENVQEPGEQQEMSRQSEVNEDRSKDSVRNEDAPASADPLQTSPDEQGPVVPSEPPRDGEDVQVDSCLESQVTDLFMQETAKEEMERDTFQVAQTEKSIEEGNKTPAPEEATSMESSASHPSKSTLLSAKDEEKPEPDKRQPPVLLREIDKDGNVTVVSDHSTSAGFLFQNSLMYELD